MKEFNGLKFDTSIRVLYKVKELKGHKTLNETYAYVGNQEDVDAMLTVARVSYNIANNTNLTEDEFQVLLSDNKIGLIKSIQIFGEVVESLMFDGTSEEDRKKVMALAENHAKK